MVVLVTGATGFLGPYVVERLISYRQTVRCLIHTPGTERTFEDSSIEIRYGDILDKDALAEASYGVNRVIHLANHNSFYKAPQEFYNSPDVNLLGTSNLLDICRSKPAFDNFILVSTLRSSRDPKSGPMYNKWCNEEQVRNSGIPYTGTTDSKSTEASPSRSITNRIAFNFSCGVSVIASSFVY